MSDAAREILVLTNNDEEPQIYDAVYQGRLDLRGCN
jgi:hypothetical protein